MTSSAVVDFADFVTFGNCYLRIDRIADVGASLSSLVASKFEALRLARQNLGEKIQTCAYMRLARAWSEQKQSWLIKTCY
jgi:hypothetical protein